MSFQDINNAIFMVKVDNAIIMAAGTSSRFAPLSYELHKSLITVKGEVLIERQIRQLHEAGIDNVIIVVGYKKEQFAYLKDKLGVTLVENNDYLIRNNNSSIYAVKDLLKNSYICSSDNYFSVNPFKSYEDEAYYAAIYAEGATDEWCLSYDKDDYINQVTIGGSNSWYMMGHTFWSSEFSRRFIQILEDEYNLPQTANKLWEVLYMEHLSELKMKIRKYPASSIFEFDSLDELRAFDSTYIADSRSTILKNISRKLGCQEKDIVAIKAFKDENNAAAGFMFRYGTAMYKYEYESSHLEKI